MPWRDEGGWVWAAWTGGWRWRHDWQWREPFAPGASPGEGGWALNPLPEGQVARVRVPFSENSFGYGVFRELRRQLLEETNTTVKIRGRRRAAAALGGSRGSRWLRGDVANFLHMVGADVVAAWRAVVRLAERRGIEADYENLEPPIVKEKFQHDGAEEEREEQDEGEEEEFRPDWGGDEAAGGEAPQQDADEAAGGEAPQRDASEAAGGEAPQPDVGGEAPQQDAAGGEAPLPTARIDLEVLASELEETDATIRLRTVRAAPLQEVVRAAGAMVEKNPNMKDWLARLEENIAVQQDLGRGGGIHIALYSTSLKRTWQAKLTLPWNVLALWPFRAYASLWMGDFNSAEDAELREFVLTTLQEPVRVGALRLLHTQELEYWHASRCKNAVAHGALSRLMAMGCTAEQVVLVNLDNDRIIGVDAVPFLRQQYAQDGSRTLRHLTNPWNAGDTYGTICCTGADMMRLGYYDEALLPSGCQDTDLIARAKLDGVRCVRVTDNVLVGTGVHNDTAVLAEHDTRAHIRAKVANVAPDYRSLRWGNMDQQNRQRMHANLRAGRVQANRERPGWQPVAMELLGLETPPPPPAEPESPGDHAPPMPPPAPGGEAPVPPFGGEAPMEDDVEEPAAAPKRPRAAVPRRAPRERACRVELVDFGLRKLVNRFPEARTALDWSRMSNRDLDGVRIRDVGRFLREEEQEFSLLFNCRVFVDPPRNTSHIGAATAELHCRTWHKTRSSTICAIRQLLVV